jgi:hypothetical protein
MPIYKISGNISEDATVYVIDSNTHTLETYEDVSAGAYEISSLASGTKIVVASKSDGESISYGNVITSESEGSSSSSGKDGAVVIDSGDVIVNDYTTVTSVGINNIVVADASAFEAGDEVLIIQTQTASANTGNWETQYIASVDSNTLYFDSAVDKTYSVSDVVQAVRIPNYTTVSIADGSRIVSKIWDGTTGGIVFFRAQGVVSIDGSVSTYSRGFRGSAAQDGNSQQTGYAGESTLPNSYSTLKQHTSVTLGGGGGGYTGKAGDYTPDGGAGGGHGTSGGDGAHGPNPQSPMTLGTGGPAYGVANLEKIFFGSGGGASYVSGRTGGGIIIISAGRINISGTGSITANGYNASSYGGGGAGGSIYLQADVLNLGSDQVSATGGSSGSYSGAGGDGRIRLDYLTLTGTVSSPSPGYLG